jgi:hypothetical protein
MVMGTPITHEQFTDVCNLLSEGESINRACKEVKVSTASVYKYMEIIGENAEKQYARARAIHLETMMSRRQETISRMHEEIKECDPKIANALVQAYKEEIRAVEWEIQRILSRKYGDKLDITSDGKSLPTAMTIVPIGNSHKCIDSEYDTLKHD